MKKRLCRKSICGSLALTMVLTGMGGGMAFLHAEETQAAETEAVRADIYPRPQAETYLSDEGISLTSEVNIVLHGGQEEATLPKLQEMLTENGYTYSDGEYDEGKSNIIISSSKDHCEDCGDVESAALDQVEGYVLTSTDSANANGDVTIIGADADGAYYGVMTLGQMIQQKTSEGRIAEVTIEDYPEIEFRGFIEGFYGYPWTHEERMSLMEDTAKYKMNTYIYAPKDDPYHRSNWKELYPADKAQEMAELAEAGHENNFNFCWTIHPGATLRFNDTDFQALITKFEQLYSLGVRQFGVLFDDTDDWYNGSAQAAFINRIDDEFVKEKGDVEPLIVVAARYNSAWGPSVSYFRPYMSDLHSDIQIMWTGAATMSNISRDVYEWPQTWTGVDRDLAVWWNYPVNDYCDGKLLMAPLHNLSTDLDNVTGFFSNPMQQADASKVALYSIADYTWNTDSFDYESSWERSIEELVPEASDAFKHFAEDVTYLSDDGGTSGPFLYNESWNSVELIDAFTTAIAEGTDINAPAQALLEKFVQIQEDAEALAGISNENLRSEINEHREAYASLGAAGENAVRALFAAEEGDLADWVSCNARAKEALNDSSNHIITSLEGEGTKESVADVGTQYLKPAVTAILNEADSRIKESAFEQFETEVSDGDGAVECTVSQDQGKYIVSDAEVSLEPGEAVQVALPKAMQIGSVSLEADVLGGLVMETSLNGKEWTKAETTVEDGAMIMNTQTAAAFIRFVNSTEDVLVLNINSLEVTPVYKASPSISTSLGTYENYAITNALDGSMDTKFWSNAAPTAGSYIQVDLGKTMPLYDIKGYFDRSDSFSNGKVQISSDGVQWTDIGAIQYQTVSGKYMTTNNADGAMARYFRFTSNASQNNWIQLFEVEFNTTVITGDDTVIVTEASKGDDHVFVSDGDLSTAYAPESVEEGDYLIYQTSRITDIGILRILQDGASISNATVEVQTADSEEWKEIGVLDDTLTELKVNDTVLAVKLTFHEGNPAPVIYEIIPSSRVDEPVVPEVDKTALGGLISETEDMDLSGYTDASVETVNTALKEAIDVYQDENAAQEDVDAAYTALKNAIDALEKPAVNKTALGELISEAEDMDLSGYTDVSVEAVNTALKEAIDVYQDENAAQEEVDAACEALKAAIDALEKEQGGEEPEVDKTALGGLISQIDNMDLSGYTDASVSALEAALNDAKDVYADENADQESVNEAYIKLNNALEALEKKTDDKPGTDKPADPEKPSDTKKPAGTDKPADSADKAVATGDSTETAGWLYMTVIAGAVLAMTAGRCRRNSHK